MKLNVVTGTPRSGSTLLCNILAQNPDFTVSSTSPLSSALATMVSFMSVQPEYQSMLVSDRLKTEERFLSALKGFADDWYGTPKLVWDKSRVWTMHNLILRQLYPESVMVVMVRDPRSIFASVEKQHRKFPAHDQAPDPISKTITGRADAMFAPDGFIGAAIIGVEDVLRRNPERTLVMDYDLFAAYPKKFIDKIYLEIGWEEVFDHNLVDVQNVATDVDGIYLNKFPHEGSGKVQPQEDDWREYVDPQLGQQILARFPYYAQRLGFV